MQEVDGISYTWPSREMSAEEVGQLVGKVCKVERYFNHYAQFPCVHANIPGEAIEIDFVEPIDEETIADAVQSAGFDADEIKALDLHAYKITRDPVRIEFK